MSMARTREAHVQLEPEEYERLEAVAAERGVSISDLIRDALQDRYLPLAEQRRRAVEAICQLRIPIENWETLEGEIAEAHGGDLS